MKLWRRRSRATKEPMSLYIWIAIALCRYDAQTSKQCIYCNVHIQICRYVFIALEICVITHKVICTCIMFIICVRICYLMFYTALFRYIIRYMFQLFSTSNYIMKSLFPLEDVQLLEKAVAGLERSVEKDFQALPCNSLDYTRRDQGDVSFFR